MTLVIVTNAGVSCWLLRHPGTSPWQNWFGTSWQAFASPPSLGWCSTSQDARIYTASLSPALAPARGCQGDCIFAASKKTAPKAKTPEPAPAPSAPNAGKRALGDLISHPMFDGGTVVAIDADKLTIEFEGNAVKQIVDHYVKQRKL